jgi:hypothetical protein
LWAGGWLREMRWKVDAPATCSRHLNWLDLLASSATIALPTGCVAPVTTQTNPYYTSLSETLQDVPMVLRLISKYENPLTNLPSLRYGLVCSESPGAVCSAIILLKFKTGGEKATV